MGVLIQQHHHTKSNADVQNEDEMDISNHDDDVGIQRPLASQLSIESKFHYVYDLRIVE